MCTSIGYSWTAYQTVGAAAPVFHPVPAPESSDMQQVQNLFNRPPPFALIANGQEFDSQQASALGRVLNIDVRKSF